MRDVKEGNFRNVKGRGGILLFTSSRLWHLKQHDQPKRDTWHTPRKNESTRPVTNRIVTHGTPIADLKTYVQRIVSGYTFP